jgi:hypothetical protein
MGRRVGGNKKGLCRPVGVIGFCWCGVCCGDGSGRSYRPASAYAIGDITRRFGGVRLFPTIRIPRLHQRNLRCDPLQLLLRGHQVVAVRRSHKSLSRQQAAGSRQQAAGSRQQANNTYTASHLPHSSATAHKTPRDPTMPHRHSKRRPVP